MRKTILITLLIVNTALSGCVSINDQQAGSDSGLIPKWVQQIESYQQRLPSNHPHQLDTLFSLSDTMRETVQTKFGSLPRPVAVKRLARWLIDKDGHAMSYDVTADFSPIQAFEKKRGNCLSFTILLASLAAELNIEIKYNEVDLPNTWSFQKDRSFVLYRHVNGLYRNLNQDLIFDLAIENYDYNYPQRVIEKALAAAKLLSNRGVSALGRDDFAAAQHYLTLAISMAPDNSDLWVNFGVVLKRQGFKLKAEKAFLHSFALNKRNSTAASNLERLYRNAGRVSLANQYQRVSDRLRRTNPYYHFHLAQKYYDSGLLKRSRRAIKRAKKLHPTDPRFYELSSRLYQREDDLAKAFNDLRKAHELAVDIRVRGRYAMKALRLNELAMESAKSR